MASSDVLQAAFKGEDSDESDAGWLLIADGLACLRLVREFLTKK